MSLKEPPESIANTRDFIPITCKKHAMMKHLTLTWKMYPRNMEEALCKSPPCISTKPNNQTQAATIDDIIHVADGTPPTIPYKCPRKDMTCDT